ncbi:monocarboxylate transporter 13-like [Amphiura filiformis]|uniref:monocarboxylate transporter 13-like n=1 Tax=Amphiura filiformis TaxID=82378 RepID=UPI003B21C030
MMKASWEHYWRWVVVFARFVALGMLVGTYKSFGVLMDFYIEDLDATAAKIGGATALFLTVAYLTGPIVGVLTELQGPNGARIQIMVGGVLASVALCLTALSTTWIHLAALLVLAGVGYGMVQVATVAPLLMYFTDQFGLANGISAAGGAAGMIILPPLTEKWIETYSWRGASILLGVASLHTTVAGALMRPPTTYKDKHLYFPINGQNDSLLYKDYDRFFTPVKNFASSLKENLSIEVFRKQPRFVLYQFIFLLSAITFAGWHLFLVPNALSRDVPPIDAAFLASIGGVGNLIGRAGNGPLLDHHIFSDTMLFVVIHFILAVVLLFDPLAQTYGTMAFLAFFAGLTVGAGYAVTVYIAKNLASSTEHGDGSVMAAVGWTHFFMGFGALLGGPLVGASFDMTGKYHLGFLIMGGVELLLTLMTLVETLYTRRRTSNDGLKYVLM